MEQATLVLTNARVHRMGASAGESEPATPDAETVVIGDGRILAVGDDGPGREATTSDTKTIDLDGRTVLPGFIDAHTHLLHEGMTQVHADLASATSREEAIERLHTHAEQVDPEASWIIGLGFDESTWPSETSLTRTDLDEISASRPVAAIRVDMHTAVVNSVALNRFGDRLADEHVRTANGKPTGVIVEDALDIIEPVTDPSRSAIRGLLTSAVDRATSLGITAVHDKVRNRHVPRAYRELDLADELDIRVRIDYWRDFLDALDETGLVSNHGSEKVTVGAIKSFTDGSIGGRTARVSEPYRDESTDNRGQWVVEPDTFRDVVTRASEAGFQLAIHAIGDEAIDLAVDELARTDGPRHRIEHVELASDTAIERMAEAGIVASMQPNFHRWARDGGLYETALGAERTRVSNQLHRMVEAGVPLAFGSDCMPMDPLYGIHHAVNAPSEHQSLSVTEAVRAYTSGAAFAGFDEDRLGSIDPGMCADIVVLDESPWQTPTEIETIDVALTIVDGTIVYDGR